MTKKFQRRIIRLWIFLSALILCYLVFFINLFDYLKINGFNLEIFLVLTNILLLLLIRSTCWYKDLFDLDKDSDILLA